MTSAASPDPSAAPDPAAPDAPGAPPGAALLAQALAQRRIAGLDFVRAVAVGMVVLGHGLEDGRTLATALLGQLAALGVELFFVLSGFLITWLLLQEYEGQRRIDLVGFYRRRMARLLPALLLYLGLAIGISLLRGREVPWAAVASTIAYVVNYYQAFTGAQTHIVAHCWSLAVEEQFYLLWPLALGAFMARGIGLARALVLVILGVWLLRLAMFHAGVGIDYLYRGLEVRADHLAVGCLLAVLLREPHWRERIGRWAGSPPVVAAAMLGLYGSALAGAASAAWRYQLGFMLEPVLAALLIAAAIRAAAGNGLAARMLEHRLPVLAGQVSYGIYLFHGMIMYTTQRLVVAATGSEALALVVACAAVLVFAAASFRFYEQPLRRWMAGAPPAHERVRMRAA